MGDASTIVLLLVNIVFINLAALGYRSSLVRGVTEDTRLSVRSGPTPSS